MDGRGGAAVNGWLLAAAAATAAAAAVMPAPAWLYPNGSGPPPVPQAEEAPVRLAGSAVTMTRRDTHNRAAALDWFPDPADPSPAIVLKASQPGGYACGFCHLPRGQGRPENAALAGLSVDYIIDQTEAFRTGARRAASPGWVPTDAMRNAIAHASAAEIAEAARWFSRQPFVSRVKVVERAMVPPTAPLGFIQAPRPGPDEPIAGRIIEVPDDLHSFELRDPRATFTAWVPPGSIARGRAIAAEMGCIECHTEQMNGWGPGRSPSYILRQLMAFKSRARNDAGAEPMQAVADQLSMDQMVAVAAWLADGAKAEPK
ncbi:hypothetical protein CAP39_00370 [Sphingomonas sp. IBVSS1]|nr:hypothetical protein CAP39_00370 [Sphingomonas sp. IBVSS1]